MTVDLNLEYRESRRHLGKWLWPVEDIWAWKWLNKIGHFDLPIQISKLVSSKDLVIQAGGNCGLYPKQYSKIFNNVVTIEPDSRNFFCLCENVKENNVVKYQKALIEQITIDSLNLAPSLIHLDIEGFEGFALLGAKDTITKHRPLIVLETNGSGDEYGWPQEKIDELLYVWGYKIIQKWDHDTVYENN